MSFNLFPSIGGPGCYRGKSKSIEEIADIIRTPRHWPQELRSIGKGSENYANLKRTKIECILANSYNKENSRSPEVKRYSTGYIYLDFDFHSMFTSIEEAKRAALAFKEELKKDNLVSLAFLSASGAGVAVFVKVGKCASPAEFDYYWEGLNLHFKKLADRNAKSWSSQLCILPSDELVYVSPHAKRFEEVYKPYRWLYESTLPYEQFVSINEPVILPEGRPTIKINIERFAKNKLREGKRNSTLFLEACKLAILMPKHTRQQILGALENWNKRYCSPFLPYEELSCIATSAFKRVANLNTPLTGLELKKGGETVLRKIWWSPYTRLSKSEKLKRIHFLLGNGNDSMTTKIKLVINQLILEEVRITNKVIANRLGKSLSTIKRYSPRFKKKIQAYNWLLRHGLNGSIQWGGEVNTSTSETVRLIQEEITETLRITPLTDHKTAA